MTILGIETSTQICGIALTKAEQLIAEYRLFLKNVHASALAGLIDSLLKQVNISIQDLSALAVSIGPGSFTGLRIGLSTAKGLALGSDIPLVTVPTLTALASQAPCTSGTICPLLKSRADEYYCATYRRHDFEDTIEIEPRLVEKKAIASTLPAESMLIGQTQEILQEKQNAARFTFAPDYLSLPTAFSIARIGFQMYSRGDIAPYETVEPMYYQEFIAGKPKSH